MRVIVPIEKPDIIDRTLKHLNRCGISYRQVYRGYVRFRPKAEIAHHKFHRLDESAPGHGMGLAVVGDIARSYGGEVSVGKSAMGGVEIAVIIPPHSTA